MLRKDLGDFQTPPALVSEVLVALRSVGKSWTRVLEPTCGTGNFIAALLSLVDPPREIQAIELQPTHAERARTLAKRARSTHVSVEHANIFDLNLGRDLHWSESGPLLVIGNPPWITNAELGILESNNLPRKTNLKGLPGIQALTGYSNFDIAEFIWIKLITELASERPTIALLCKTVVARNVLQYSFDMRLPVSQAVIWRIDAKKWFGASADACLFCVTVGADHPRYDAPIFPSLNSTAPEVEMGFAGGRLVSDLAAYRQLAFVEGSCPVVWRQGVKHDAASVMEITVDSKGCVHNKLGEIVDVEPDYVFPLLKGTDLYHQRDGYLSKSLIVTQHRLGENTLQFQETAPRLWAYLNAHAHFFERRKSSIYRGQPPFALFGVGDYSFAPYKVAVSGLHKTPKFRAIGPVYGKPVMLDDTCYFVPCGSPVEAALLTSLLNDSRCLGFIQSLIFMDSKRPITKGLLSRVDLKALLAHANRKALILQANEELGKLAGRREVEGEEDWLHLLDQFRFLELIP